MRGTGADLANIPIFPLNAVLFPGGVLPLRIFEARYMDMVRDCMQRSEGFGICLLRSGVEVGDTATPEDVGCLAEILEWDMPKVGMLHIRALGTQRFRIRQLQAQPDKLLRADIDWIAPDSGRPIAPEHIKCVGLLRSIVEESQAKNTPVPLAEPLHYDDSSWLSNRLCEVLPISMRAKQKLMELEDGSTRLSLVQQFLKQHHIL